MATMAAAAEASESSSKVKFISTMSRAGSFESALFVVEELRFRFQ